MLNLIYLYVYIVKNDFLRMQLTIWKYNEQDIEEQTLVLTVSLHSYFIKVYKWKINNVCSLQIQRMPFMQKWRPPLLLQENITLLPSHHFKLILSLGFQQKSRHWFDWSNTGEKQNLRFLIINILLQEFKHIFKKISYLLWWGFSYNMW